MGQRQTISPFFTPQNSHLFPARFNIAGRISVFQFAGYLL
jgi:hypothetical protein